MNRLYITLVQPKFLNNDMTELDTLELGGRVLAKVGYSPLFERFWSIHFYIIFTKYY